MKGELHVEVHQPGDVDDVARAAGRTGPPPRPLSFWRQYLDEHGGCVPGVDGERVPVDLSPWADAPESTLLSISVRWVDPHLVGTVDPHPPAWVTAQRR